jgi:parvulin-like peptidyl-prolyl isomerase
LIPTDKTFNSQRIIQVIMNEKSKPLKNLLILFVFLIINSCARQEPEPIIARAGKTTIPLSEFRDRYEFTPHILLTKNKQRNKRQVLISLLGEKMLAEEAYHTNLTENEKFQTYSVQMEKEAIIEALFEKEVASNIQISDEEVKQAFMLSQSELDVQVLSFDHAEQAWEAKKQIDAGKSLHQVKREFQTDTFISADSVLTLTMKWGESHPKIEQVAFQLKPNEVSDPVEADGISFIIKLINKRANVLITEADYLREAPSIRKKIKQRKRAEMFTDFMHSLMAEKQVKVSHEIFNFVAGELEKFYPIEDTSTTSENIQRSMEFPLDSLKNENLADHLNDTFARFNDGSTWTVGDFIKKLSIGPFRLSYKSRESFRNSLRRAIRRMIEFESLAQKGREAGLQNRYYVRYQKKMWDDAYLAQQLQQAVIDTVTISNEEVKNYYNQHKNNYTGPEMVNLQEILVDDESLSHQLFQRIKNGEDIAKLAQKYNKRAISQRSNGIMGYFTTSSLGKIGETARSLKIGEIGGPVKTEKNQFSIFKILDKKEAGPLPLEEVWNSVKRDALSDKRIRAIDNFLVQLAAKYEIEINQTILDTLTTTDISMMVLKQHFPNRTAAPFVTPLQKSYQWQRLMHDVLPSEK